MTVRLLEQGVAAASSASIALGQLDDRTKVVASVLAYDDCFLIYAGMALLTLLPVLMVPRRRQRHCQPGPHPCPLSCEERGSKQSGSPSPLRWRGG